MIVTSRDIGCENLIPISEKCLREAAGENRKRDTPTGRHFSFFSEPGLAREKAKTINSRYSLVVTHPTTNLPAHGLSTAERTGSPVFHVLWSIAKEQSQM
jgi:hypothetical protein